MEEGGAGDGGRSEIFMDVVGKKAVNRSLLGFLNAIYSLIGGNNKV